MAHAKAHSTTPTPTFAPTWDIRKGTEADMRWLATRLITGSLDEIDAVSRFQPLSVLLKDMDRKTVIVAKAKPNHPVMVFELNLNTEDQNAVFWSAMTEEAAASDHYWSFSEYAHGFLQHANSLYPSIVTYVDARNLKQIAWLERVGFILAEELPQYGRKELPFKIYIRRNNSDL